MPAKIAGTLTFFVAVSRVYNKLRTILIVRVNPVCLCVLVSFLYRHSVCLFLYFIRRANHIRAIVVAVSLFLCLFGA